MSIKRVCSLLFYYIALHWFKSTRFIKRSTYKVKLWLIFVAEINISWSINVSPEPSKSFRGFFCCFICPKHTQTFIQDPKEQKKHAICPTGLMKKLKQVETGSEVKLHPKTSSLKALNSHFRPLLLRPLYLFIRVEVSSYRWQATPSLVTSHTNRWHHTLKWAPCLKPMDRSFDLADFITFTVKYEWMLIICCHEKEREAPCLPVLFIYGIN